MPREIEPIAGDAKVRAKLAGDPAWPAAQGRDGRRHARRSTARGRRARLARARLALSELCGLGPIDRLWADRSIRAVFVNGPDSVYVERDGVIEPSPERFRDGAHLAEIVGRLVRRATSPAVAVSLRDGSEGVVLFPPAAPAGPVLTLRRGEPGERDPRTAGRGRTARPADGRPVAHRNAQPAEYPGGRARKAGKTALAGGAGARSRRCRGSSPWRGIANSVGHPPRRVEVDRLAAGDPWSPCCRPRLRLRPDLLVVDSLQTVRRLGAWRAAVGAGQRAASCAAGESAGDRRRAAASI